MVYFEDCLLGWIYGVVVDFVVLWLGVYLFCTLRGVLFCKLLSGGKFRRRFCGLWFSQGFVFGCVGLSVPVGLMF